MEGRAGARGTAGIRIRALNVAHLWLGKGVPVRLHSFPPSSSWSPTLLTEFTILRLHLLLIPVTVIVIVGVMLHVLEAQAGYIGHMRAHLLGAPVG